MVKAHVQGLVGLLAVVGLAAGCTTPKPAETEQPIDVAEAKLSEFAEEGNRVASVSIGWFDLTVTAAPEGKQELTVTSLYRVKGSVEPVDSELRRPTIAGADLPVSAIVGRARELWNECGEDGRPSVDTTVLSETSYLTELLCDGVRKTLWLGPDELKPIEAGLSEDAVRTLLDEASAATGGGKAQEVVINDTAMTVVFPMVGTRDGEVVRWRRGLANPSPLLTPSLLGNGKFFDLAEGGADKIVHAAADLLEAEKTDWGSVRDLTVKQTDGGVQVELSLPRGVVSVAVD